MTQATTTENVAHERFGGALADAREALGRHANIDRLADEWLGICAAAGWAALFYAAPGGLAGWRAFEKGERKDISSWRIAAQSAALFEKAVSGRRAAVCNAAEFAAFAGREAPAGARSVCLVPLIVGGMAAGAAMFGSEAAFSAEDAAALEELTGLLAARVFQIYRNETAAPRSASARVPEVTLSEDDEKKMRKILRKIESLPAMPNIAGKVLEMVEDAGTSVKDLQRLINNDQILAAKILKVANSSYYCGGMDVDTLSEAIVILGFNTLRSLVIAASMRSLYAARPSRRGTTALTRFAIHQKSLWEHSVACAAVARNIAKKTRHENPEAAFVAGLLHDMGRLVMFKEMPDECERWLKERGQAAETGASDILATEREIFTFDHCLVGAAVAKKWKLADELAFVMANHHFAETGVAPTPLSAIVDFANIICMKNGIGPVAAPSLDVGAELKRLPLSLAEADVKEMQEELSRILAAEAFFL